MKIPIYSKTGQGNTAKAIFIREIGDTGILKIYQGEEGARETLFLHRDYIDELINRLQGWKKRFDSLEGLNSN